MQNREKERQKETQRRETVEQQIHKHTTEINRQGTQIHALSTKIIEQRHETIERDKGTISGKGFVFDVLDTQKIGDHHGHFGVVKEGALKIDTKVKAHIDEDFRKKIVPNHSATHLLQAALKQILGDHIEQKGSLVKENRLRFDFSHSKQVSAEEIIAIEDLVNIQIEKNSKSVTEVMTIEQATKKGAIAFFGEKYGEEVRVLDLGEGFSVELCGGTHVKTTGEIGLMKIISESGISAGVRRIEAVTGVGATLLLQELE
jgi:alanyl-tRNA synthetase